METRNTTGEPSWREIAAPVTCPVVVIAASAGGIQALAELLPSIPPGFSAAIAIALHRAVSYPNHLISVLRGYSRTLTVLAASDGSLLEPATVYVCPAGMHMTADRRLRLIEGPRLNYVRPSADLMFVSVARAYGRQAIGVVLSGTGTDAAIGCKAIVDAGGTVIAQTPASAEYPDMPAAAVALGPAQLILPPGEIGPALQHVLEQSAQRSATTKVLLADDHRIMLDGLRVLLGGERDLVVLPRAAEDGRAAVQLSAELGPDVVVMDLAMPGMDGIAATREIREQNPATKIIALSAHADADTTQLALRAGASVVISKQKTFAELPAAIRSAMSDRLHLGCRDQPAMEASCSLRADATST